jgi:elongation factor 3
VLGDLRRCGLRLVTKPHTIALDEPTNYLDNDTLAALTRELKNFKGAVITVSHHEAFIAALCTEKWEVAGGKLATTTATGDGCWQR